MEAPPWGLEHVPPLVANLSITTIHRTCGLVQSGDIRLGLGTLSAYSKGPVQTFWKASRGAAARPGLSAMQENQPCKLIYRTELALLNAFTKLSLELITLHVFLKSHPPLRDTYWPHWGYSEEWPMRFPKSVSTQLGHKANIYGAAALHKGREMQD